METRIPEMAETLRAIFPAFGAAGRPLVRPLFGLLAQGRPVTPEALAGATGLPPATVRRHLSAWWGVRFDDDGAVIGFWGLDLFATRHQLRVGERDLFAWCAWDTLFLPGLIGEEAEVTTLCPASGDDIRLRVAPEGVLDAEPDDVRLALTIPDPQAARANVRGAFCCDVRFLVDADAARQWQADHPAVRLLSLEEGHRLGRAVWAGLLGEEG
ncbi:MAG TPA: organomercurial lyase [Gammaproteobacteria bacterium]|nr:organomercurial lyase [Gammaproteobacteria bacterium]